MRNFHPLSCLTTSTELSPWLRSIDDIAFAVAEKILAAGPAAQLLEDAQQKTLRQLYVGSHQGFRVLFAYVIWVESQQSRGCKADNDGLQA